MSEGKPRGAGPHNGGGGDPGDRTGVLHPILKTDGQGTNVSEEKQASGGFLGALTGLFQPVRGLAYQLEELLYPPSGPRIATEDPELFKGVMNEFHTFEQGAYKQSGAANQALQILMRGCQQKFEKDFPLYIALSFRTSILKRGLYRCESLSKFVDMSANLFGSLDAMQIARTLKGFLSREDFTFYCNAKYQQSSDEPPITRWAFLFLKLAFGNLLGGLKSDDSFRVYPRMVWITTYLRLCLLKPDQALPSRLWHEHLLKEAHVYTMDPTNIQGVVDALDLGRELELPPKFTFDTSLMGVLLAPDTGNKLRYFSHQRNAIIAFEQYFTSSEDFLSHIVLRVRKQCEIKASKPKSKYLKYISADGTRLQAIIDGLNLLNSMLHIVTTKKWELQLFHSDMQQWLLFLLGLIDLTENPQECLEEMLSPTLPVVLRFKDFICDKIVELTRKSLRGLSVQQFFPLYKVALHIWPCELLEEYLDEHIYPPDVKFSDPLWNILLHDAVQRLPGAANQMFQRFFKKVATVNYSRASSFIVELLQVGVNGLLSVHADHVTQDREAVQKFDRDLQDFIAKNLSKGRLLLLTKEMLKCADDKENSFQDVVLTAIHKKIIPGARDLLEVPLYSSAIGVAVDVLKKDPTWPLQKELSVKQKFCLRFINTCCIRIPVSSRTFTSMTRYSDIISQIGSVFCSFASMRKSDGKETLLAQSIPSEVSRRELVIQYFVWVRKLHKMLSNWKTRLETETANYDDIFWYYQNQQQIRNLAKAVSADGVTVTAHEVSDLRSTFLHYFEQLNVLLLRYISTDPKGGWCSLMYVLTQYGLEVPLDIQSMLENHVVFPDEYEKRSASLKLLMDPPTPCTDGKFSPPNQRVQLRLTQSMGLSTLCALVELLSTFLEPLKPYLGLIVYFKLYPSKLFDTYIRHELSGAKTVSLPLLTEALKQTEILLQRVLNGTAMYGEITAAGCLALESLDIDGEFNTLSQCSRFTSCDTSGLTRVKKLLKVIQFIPCIQTIRTVCHHYHLENCKKDPQLEELTKIAEKLSVKAERDKLTPEEADRFWQTVCVVFCLKEDANPKSLELLSKVADSTDFFQFLEEKQFTGTKGSDRFRRQFELVTAQLQHEEYCDMVLIHLLAAFRFLSPFLDRSHNLKSLMSSIAALEFPEGLPQLETVKCNIHQIRYWFSRAEDTLENVSSELDDILRSGNYHIVRSSVCGRSVLHLVLEYETYRSISAQRPKRISDDFGTSAPIVIQRTRTGSQRVVKVKLSSAQVDDFVRQLGFLDAHKDEQKVQSFLHLHEVATRLLEVFEKLKQLGHPTFSQSQFVYTLACSDSSLDADEKVSKAESTLMEWINTMEELHSSYKWLLFFRVPKLMILCDLLRADKPCVSEIVQEIGFLFQRDAVSRALLQNVVRSAMESRLFKDTALQEHAQKSAMDVVGSFLGNIFSKEGVIDCSLPMQCRMIFAPQDQILVSSPQISSTIHCAPGFSQGQLIRLLLEVYDGSPNAFQVLRCTPVTVEQDLRLFMKRVVQHPMCQYLILEVNILPFQLQEVLLRLYLELRHKCVEGGQTCLHFIETAPSMLQEVPWLTVAEHREEGSTEVVYTKAAVKGNTKFKSIQLVYGLPGNGKTHYISEKLKSIFTSGQITIAVNEAFSCISAIEKLCTLPLNATGCAIFFNFTMLPPVESANEKEKAHYCSLMQDIGWFFFDLLILGYIEDPATGKSFQVPGDLSWEMYVEVPSRADMSAEDALEHFKNEIPTLGLLGTPHLIDTNRDYSIDDDVQLVCKYLKAYDTKKIDTLYRERGPCVKFSEQPLLPPEECKSLLQKYMPTHIKNEKITQKLFVRYMKRRCKFLDNLPAFNYNTGCGEYVKGRRITDTRHLGSTLMETMLKEVSDFCDPAIKEGWSQRPHQQLIYDFKDGGGSLDLISLLPDELSKQDKVKFSKIGVQISSMRDLYSRARLDTYLSRALNVPLQYGRLSPIDERQYVLTLDYTLKMLNIHERYECGIPVIIEGETGVGKTALVGMLSQLWNHSWLSQWDRIKSHIVELMKMKTRDSSMDTVDESMRAVCVEAVYNLSAGNNVPEDVLDTIGQLPSSSDIPYYYTVLNSHLKTLNGDPILSMLDIESVTLAEAFNAITEESCSSKSTARLLNILFNAKMKTAFHKLNIHAAIQPKDIEKFFSGVFAQAQELQQSYDACDESKKPSYRVPFVTAYLDEINTASCLGLLKEVIVDKTFDGKRIPENVFIIASCNPHRGDILAAIEDQEAWLKGTYYVRKLHPTLQFLMWDYGSLNKYQEQEYVNAKLEILNRSKSSEEASLTDLIVRSQQKMREYAFEQLQALQTVKLRVAKLCARSSVSQRDIQRVFTFYQWLMKFYSKFDPHKEQREKYHRRAMMVSLGIVYYMRLNSKYRKEYRQYLDFFDHLSGEITFSQAIEDELQWFIEQVELPPNIVKTEALKENVFVTIACAVTHTPLIIVGDPGSSKTLSFNIAIANLKGKESRNAVFRDTDIFQSLDPHFYQCSRQTTSKEVAKVFIRAINRQQSLAKIPLPISCVVFMDEAGLPEEKLESLKVLHYYLDKQEVSFVAISNHVLDAAKTNRAVSLFRPKAREEELRELARENIVPAGQPQSELHTEQVRSFCLSYKTVVSDNRFQSLFGLRDFIHFVTYLRCKRKELLSHQLVLEALERNFNGTNEFKELCHIFKIPIEKLHARSVLDILKDSLADHSSTRGGDIHNSIQSEVRYKLIIDPSEDDSLVRLLFTHEVFQRKSTRLYICSDFPGDEQLRVNTIAQIRHSVAAGHTILMCQTDEIHECFYDLFNQRFRSIEDPERGTCYYTNIAIGAHSKPCRVHPDFQCVIVIKESEVQNTPAPFLNRFEKYCLTHKSLLQNALCKMPPCLRIMIEAAYSKAAEFVSCVKPSSLYGYTNETLESLLLTMLPVNYKYQPLQDLRGNLSDDVDQSDARTFLLKVLLEMLQQNCGFHLPLCSEEKLIIDANHVYEMVLKDPEFTEVIAKIKVETIPALVDEALLVLHRGPEPTDKDTPFDIYTDALMVIAVLMQWLVGYLCTHLMQLMTPEALAVHCSSIPNAYIQKYLKAQQHFSLIDLVDNQLVQLKRNGWNSSVCPTKLLCFTRSSPFIHQLPSEYPSALSAKSVTQQYKSLKKYVYSDLEHLMLCKISLGLSRHKLEKLLYRFVNSDCEVLLLIANMQEITKKMINHLRIMIEEAENKKLNKNKLFVLLLHFPPVMFFSPCYPSLFLQGWGHHYLDTVACGTLTTEGIKAVVNVKEWFYYSCFPQCFPKYSDDDHMFAALEELLAVAVPIIASRVSFIVLQNGTTNVMDAYQRTQCLKQLLYEKKLSKLLVAKFCSYWTPKVMVEYIQRVSKMVFAQESTLNITDSIHSIVRSTFFDYLVYMFARTNQQLYLSIILDHDCPPAMEDLFLKLMPTIGVPDLTQLQSLCATFRPTHQPNKVDYSPKFPFFIYIYDTVEKVIDESREEVSQRLNSLDSSGYRVEASSVTASICLTQMTEKQQKEKIYNEVVLSRLHSLEHNKKACLEVAVASMKNDTAQEIWKRYFEDFAHFKLHLESKVLPLTSDILKSYFGLMDGKDFLARLVSLHVRLEVGQLDLGNLSRILRPISRVQQEMQSLSPDALVTSITLMESVLKRPPTLGVYTVDILFTAISSLKEGDDDTICQWHRSYNDIMTMPSLEGDILSNLKPEAETKLNIMHATYLVMQSCLDSRLLSQQGYQFFRVLHSKYFGVGFKGKAAVPRLCEILRTGLATLDTLSPEQESESYCRQSFIEGLFAFFFSKHRVALAEEDCYYFLEFANRFCQVPACHVSDQCQDQSSPLFNCTSINVFKFYLSRILGESSPQRPSELSLHDPQRRKIVGDMLIANLDHSSPGTYIPTFYQHGERNSLMRQPLAHIYFLTVLEHLQMKGHLPTHLCRLAEKVTKPLQEVSKYTRAEYVLCCIEKQAVIQVLIQQVAAFFDPKNPKKVQNLFTANLIQKVNAVLNNESFGGSSSTVSGHGLVLALHLQRQLKSSRKLIEMFVQEESVSEGAPTSSSVRTVECTKGLQSLVKKQLKARVHLLPFQEQTSEIGRLYQKIFQVMTKISCSEGSQLQSSIQDLLKLAQDSDHKMKFTTVSGHEIDISKRNAFRMLIWLCAYYKFFLIKENHSQKLADEIYNSLRGTLEPEFIGLLQSFICPKNNMIIEPESPPNMDENATKFELTESLQVLPLQTGGKKKDPIFELFNPPANSKQDPSDVELCHAVVNMVAVVLACEPRSNHLWYHMFAADELLGSYMTGFMYEGKITEGRLYDCGVELSSDGTYGRPDYLPHATRGTLSLHSLYFILWANFGSFCMALLTQPDAQQRISGPVISKWQAIRHYCVMQLRSVWLHMGNKLKISPEEQSFLTLRCMHNLLEICTRHPQPRGVFSDLTQLDSYETMWHANVFTPGYTDIHTKFAQHCKLWENNALLKEVSKLEVHYPHFPTLDEFFQIMLSSANVSDTKNQLFVLSKFALEYPRLETAGALLPELLEFYRWIHIELAYRVTFKYAENHTIQDVIEKADGEYKKHDVKGVELLQLYEKVKAGYNRYVEVVGSSIGAGACASIKREGRLYYIKDDTKFLHFLSDTENEGEGNDWLYIVINDMINFHNSFLQSIFDAVTSPNGTYLRPYFPENLDSRIYPNEVNEQNMIIGQVQRTHGIEEQLQLVRSRHLQTIDGQTQDPKLLFDLPRLQKDIIRAYLAGKPQIEHSPEHVRIPFKFRAEASQTVSLGGADLDLSVISEYITPDSGFRVMLDREHIKAFECEFHSADYNRLVEVVTGLRNATEHLIKSISLEVEHTSMERLKQMQLPDFLLHIFNCEQSKEREEIIADIGIKSLSQTQLSCIVSLELPYLYCTLELFVQWINDRVYDFHDLPLCMKKHLEPADEETLDKLPAEYTDPDVLFQELQSLTDVLVHSQSHLRKHINENLKKPIIIYLRELSLFGEEHLARSIPESVLSQHYVALRIALRRLVFQVQSLISARSLEGVQTKKWVEFVADLWTEEKLKHLRDVAMPFSNLFQFDPETQLYGFEEITDVDDETYLFTHSGEKPAASAEETPQPASIVKQRKVAVATPITEKETLEAVAASLSVYDVAEFLRKWKMQKYEEEFIERDMDGALLLSLCDEDLKDFGIANGFDRRKILSKFKQHLQELAS